MNLIVSYFEVKNDERKKEIDDCLVANINNPLITKIILLLESGDPPVFTDKVEVIEHCRPTYADMFWHVKDGEVNIIANSDIYFNSTLEASKDIHFNSCYAITRHEFRSGAVKKFEKKAEWSQDVWIVKRKPSSLNTFENCIALNLDTNKYEEIPFYLGVAGCDNHVAYLLKNANYNVVNPYPSIQAVHLHSDEERNYNMRYRITGLKNNSWGKLSKVNPTKL